MGSVIIVRDAMRTMNMDMNDHMELSRMECEECGRYTFACEIEDGLCPDCWSEENE